MVGYWFGVKGGTYLYNKEDTFWFKEKYLLQSRDFFDKYGGKAIIFARFLPIFRTFAPIVAGIASMDKKKFMLNNIVGSVLWSFQYDSFRTLFVGFIFGKIRYRFKRTYRIYCHWNCFSDYSSCFMEIA